MIGILERIYSKLPSFSPELKGFVVKILPVLVLLAGVVMLAMSAIEVISTPFFSVLSINNIGLPFLITNLLGILIGILMIIGFKGLRKRKLIGWKYIFWSQIVWIVSQLIWIFTGNLSISISLILAIIFLYPLFEVKNEYK